MTDHECSPGIDPRFKRSCVRCGRLLRTEVVVPVQDAVQSDGRARQPAVERDLHRSLGVDPGLSAFAQARCEDGAVRRWESRDFLLECREEAADLLNYATWELQRIADAGGPGERFQAVAMALQSVSEAWQMLAFAERS